MAILKKMVASLMVAAILVPHITLAQTTKVQPTDEAVKKMLADLNISLSGDDPVWKDKNFIAFVELYQKVDENSQELLNDVELLVNDAFDLIELGEKVDQEDFNKLFNLSEEEKELLLVYKESMNEFFQLIKEESDNWTDSLFEEFSYEYSDNFGETDFTEYMSNRAYVITNSQGVIYSKELNWIDTNLGADAKNQTIEVTQTYGNAVTWMNSTNKDKYAFIAPEVVYPEYVEFLVTSEKNGSVTQSYAGAYVYPRTDDPIVQTYLNTLGRYPDRAGYTYWTAEHKAGVSLDHIANHMKQSQEYKTTFGF